MAPFVPEFISEQMNLLVALFIGIGFGFVLEQAGFSSSKRLAGVFYGYDFTVLRVFFTAAVTAMLGVIVLGHLGLLDTRAIFVNPTWLKPAILGGVIMGLGFILGGYCPGTSVCAAAIGKIDALFFVLGGVLGVFAFGELYPLYQGFNDSTALGPLRIFDSLHISQGAFAFGMVIAAVGAFIFTTRIERKVAPGEAPSQGFPVWQHRLAGAIALTLGGVALFLPDYRVRMLQRVSRPSCLETHAVPAMTPDELAFRVLDQDPRLQIVDIRHRDAFAKLALPGSIHSPLEELFNRDLAVLLSRRGVKKVVVGDSEVDERRACLLLKELGYENLVILQGAFPAFDQLILGGAPFVPLGNRWDGDLRKFREDARAGILKQIAAAKTEKKAPKVEKKIQGGC